MRPAERAFGQETRDAALNHPKPREGGVAWGAPASAALPVPLQGYTNSKTDLRLGRTAGAVVSISGLHHEVFLCSCEIDLVIAGCGIGLVGRVAQAVLVA